MRQHLLYSSSIRPDRARHPPDSFSAIPGAVSHGALIAELLGSEVPEVSLPSTLGGRLDLAEAARGLLAVYVYPRTGRPGEPPPEGWDEIPGARGCTPQSCAFRDHVQDLAEHGAKVLGVSAQSPVEQAEFAAREQIPYPLLSDGDLRLAERLGLPTFEVAGMRLYRRLTLIARARRIEKVFYPVPAPERNASEVLAWLEGAAKGRAMGDTGLEPVTSALSRRRSPN
jgi:peroxiredoxin